MDVQLVTDFLLWCLILNYAVLLWWFAAFVFARSWIFKLHRRWFRFSEELFDSVHYTMMGIYKIGILLLNLVPYIALRILRS
jgi:hypothetical protein